MNVVRLIRSSDKPVRLVNTGGVVYYGSGTVLPDLPLLITANGQTRWNVGHGEPRKTLFYNGERMISGVHYKIELPYLDWLSAVLIETSDSLVLTS